MDTLQTLQITWFALWSILWAVYFMLDGFVLGTGMVQRYVAKDDKEKQAMLGAIGPVWNGNEVWLITAGGATFAAFPKTYALMFSYLYTAMLLLLFALILRGVSIEFRNQITRPGWKKLWDNLLQLSCLLIALLLGVAFGNIFQGLPMDAAGYHGNFLTLLNAYGLLTGLLFILLFLVHGAIYTALKTTGNLRMRALAFAGKAWTGLLVVAVLFLAYSAFATRLYDNYLRHPALFLVPAVAVAALILIRYSLAQGKEAVAFGLSSALILSVSATGLCGIFPALIPSSLGAAYNLTIYNSSSSQLTLSIMTVVALIFVPIVIAYKIWVYRIFSGRISPDGYSGAPGY